MTEFEQTLLFASTGIVLLGTLIVFAWQYYRMNRRDEDD
jgi:predicted negative regulator of RcsB-dependent stress response